MNWDKLAERISQRRHELGLSKRAAVRAAELAANTWLKVENDAQPIEEHLLVKIDRALQWESGSCHEVLNGGEPTELPSKGAVEEQIEELRRRVERLEAQLNK